MSELMDRAIIGMPYELAMGSELSRRQFYARAQALLAEVERLRKDAERLDRLAAQARMIYGHKDQASYQLSELPELIQSSREECLPDDLRRAIDDMEASR